MINYNEWLFEVGDLSAKADIKITKHAKEESSSSLITGYEFKVNGKKYVSLLNYDKNDNELNVSFFKKSGPLSSAINSIKYDMTGFRQDAKLTNIKTPFSVLKGVILTIKEFIKNESVNIKKLAFKVDDKRRISLYSAFLKNVGVNIKDFDITRRLKLNTLYWDVTYKIEPESIKKLLQNE